MIVAQAVSSGRPRWSRPPSPAWPSAEVDQPDEIDEESNNGDAAVFDAAADEEAADGDAADHAVPVPRLPAVTSTQAAAPELLHHLMRGTQGRCPHAFRRLHALTRTRLFGVILRINRNRAESEDLLQDVFVKVWQQCGRFDSRQGDVAAWLAAIARNTAISSLRSRSCRPQLGTAGAWSHEGDAAAGRGGDPAEQTACHGAGPLDDAMRSQARRAVRSSLMQLNVEQRESLQLAFFEGLSHQEIAIKLGRPLGTVKSTVRRALLAMRPGLHAHALTAQVAPAKKASRSVAG